MGHVHTSLSTSDALLESTRIEPQLQMQVSAVRLKAVGWL